ncbi:metallophosphoesterase [Bacillus sp. JJ1764]|uniref:metallophosphoesterase n=1 Tax=Bacillus sp. JJ1764 TaxID=3122964 RepID=UPI0030005E49
MLNKPFWTFLFTVLLVLPSSLTTYAEERPSIDLRLLETTDIHADLVNYDYYQTKVDHRIGLVKTATLIKQARMGAKNSLLFDCGDHLKGNPLGEYLARIKGIHSGKIHPVYRAFNYLGYDTITIGNHEFNYGLKFLNAALKGANMPVVNANVYSVKTNNPYFRPYVILKRKLTDLNGKQHELKIGVIGFLPIQIMKWDRANLEGKVYAKPILEAAQHFIPQMKAEGADLIVALAHTGISGDPYRPDTENAVYYLTKIPGIDAILSGHSHSVFPGPVYEKLPHTNLKTGNINGKPVVMAGAFGNHLGIVDLKLSYFEGKWKVVKGISKAIPIADTSGKPLVKSDKGLFKTIKADHQETVDFIKRIGL